MEFYHSIPNKLTLTIDYAYIACLQPLAAGKAPHGVGRSDRDTLAPEGGGSPLHPPAAGGVSSQPALASRPIVRQPVPAREAIVPRPKKKPRWVDKGRGNRIGKALGECTIGLL